MRYMLMIYTPPDGGDSEMQEWFDYTKELQDAGVFVAGDALDDVKEAVTVRTRNGETIVSDGPFAETREVLGGYYIVDVDRVEEAKHWASKIPSTRYGSTEVRRIPDYPTPE